MRKEKKTMQFKAVKLATSVVCFREIIHAVYAFQCSEVFGGFR